jgi:pilus assembly protein Flp/PilA
VFRGFEFLRLNLFRWELQDMKNLVKRFAGLVRNEEGASLVEYGLLVGLIAVVCIGAVTLVGGSVEGLFNQVATAL